ncbi:MAG TPA: hypothetical protein VNM67_09545 [Thermoanaerobaculia bacterium]|nr:hypothetical protein [Thermoanaerobaculia bacterium]
MIPPDLPGSERQRIERVAEEYRTKGYEVLVEPSGSDLPPFLGDHRPDLIARRGDERLVIELKPSPSQAEPGRVRSLAERVQREPGWKLVLIALSPAEELLPGEQLSLLDSPEVEQHLAHARGLLEAGQPEAALLLAWAAVEARLRVLAKQEEIPLPRPGTLTLLRQLVSLGIIDREQHRVLSDAFKARSAVAHGFKPQSGIESNVRSLLELSKTFRS